MVNGSLIIIIIVIIHILIIKIIMIITAIVTDLSNISFFQSTYMCMLSDENLWTYLILDWKKKETK